VNGKTIAEKLIKCRLYKFIFTKHAELRLVNRQIEKKLVIRHLQKPDSLKMAEKLPAGRDDEKYKLWFVPSKRIAYIYIIVINYFQQRIVIKTVIKQRLMWQKRVEKHVK